MIVDEFILMPMTKYMIWLRDFYNSKIKEYPLVDHQSVSKIAHKSLWYANFLLRKIELWMFFPCDEDGNVLKEPEAERCCDGGQGHLENICGCRGLPINEEYYIYQQAQERVLFKLTYRQERHLRMIFFNPKEAGKIPETIEELIDILHDGKELVLTSAAQKELGHSY